MIPFVQSKRVQSVLAMSKMYHVRPSQILNLEDEYTAFCFDEACANIIAHLQDGDKPIWIEDRKVKHYSTFTDLLKGNGVG